MAPQPLWTEDEWTLLLELYSDTDGHPTDEAVQRLRLDLRALARVAPSPARRRAAEQPGYRTHGAIWSQISYVRALDEGRATRDVPTRLSRPWRRLKENPDSLREVASTVRRRIQSLEEEPSASAQADAPTADAETIKDFLHEAHDLLGDVVHTVQHLPVSMADPEAVDGFVAAWRDLQERPFVEAILTDLDRPDVLARLPEVGLAGSQLQMKISGWRKSIAEWFRARTTRSLKAALDWANILLGSLKSVVLAPAIELLKEYKESTERMLEDAVPPGGFLPVPAVAY